MTSEEQLDEWVNGNSIHNDENRPILIVDENDNVVRTVFTEGGECCPDFSCCQPNLKWPDKLRQKFKQSDEQTRQSMLFMSLQQLTLPENISTTDNVKVYIPDGSSVLN